MVLAMKKGNGKAAYSGVSASETHPYWDGGIFGGSGVQPLTENLLLVDKPWSMLQTWKSPAYTTNWSELPVVKATVS